MIFSLDISTSILSLLGLSVTSTIIILAWHFTRLSALSQYRKKLRRNELDYIDDLPPVSIIVYASNDADNIMRNLPIMLAQEYLKYEIIVVNDSSTDNSDDILTEMELQYKNLYQTFVPKDTCNLSRKKLSVTLGVKAAKYDIVLSTAANCRPQNDKWLASIIRNFTPETDIVIGYSHIDYTADKNIWHWFRAFDMVISASLYLSYALKSNPYRGDGNNLAYRKHIFFDNKGFSRSLNLHFGDDDLFINEVATNSNTRIELSPDSQLVAEYENIPLANHELKMRYDFTARYLRTSAVRVLSLISIAFWTLTLSAITSIILDPTNIFTVTIASITWIATITSQILFFRTNASVLEAPKLLTCIPFFTLIRPFVNLKYKIEGRSTRISNYTWQRRQ